MQEQKPELIFATCENCEKQMEENKLDLHFSYCKRNVKKC